MNEMDGTLRKAGEIRVIKILIDDFFGRKVFFISGINPINSGLGSFIIDVTLGGYLTFP